MITVNTILKRFGVICIGAILFGCTDRFEEYNKNPNGITPADLDKTVDVNSVIKNNLTTAQKNIYVYQPAWITQLQQNLLADVYSGYMMPPTPFRGNSNNMTYALVDGWNEWAFNPGYDNVMNPIAFVEEKTKSNSSLKDLYAMAKIVKVEAMHRVSDIFGPIIYTKYKVIGPDGNVEYDTQEEAYNAFFADLKEAIDILTPLAGTTASTTFVESDLVYGGSYSKWLRFANSLRLRLAIRISKVNPTKAKVEGEAALANSGGLLTSSSDNFSVDFGTTNHPLNVMNNEWGDIRMGAPMESIMGGYNDPRLPKYFVKAIDPKVAGEYKGIRNGINIDAKTRYQDYSMLITFPNKGLLMTAAEVWFLKAEAAILSWSNSGTAATNYEKGIEESFNQYGLADAATYKVNAVDKPKPYLDPKSITAGQNDILAGNPNLSTITIKWDDAASLEVKRERIITQKWIAMYPDGQEAWSEFRRTGYPKLFPVVINNSGGTISGFIKRVNFPQGEYATNKFAIDRIVAKLGGPDTGGTALWWDVD